MSTSFSGSLPLLSTLFVFYYTDFMANKICMYVCMYVWVHKWTLADKTRSLVYKNFLVYFHAKAVKLVSAFHHRRFHLNYLNSFGDFDRFRSGIARFLWQRVFIPRKKHRIYLNSIDAPDLGCDSNRWRRQDFAPEGARHASSRNPAEITEILHKYNKVTLSQIKRLWICGWNGKTCGVH